MNDEEETRLVYLEEKAKRLFIENSKWSDIIAMLTPDERAEVDELLELMDKDYEAEKLAQS